MEQTRIVESKGTAEVGGGGEKGVLESPLVPGTVVGESSEQAAAEETFSMRQKSGIMVSSPTVGHLQLMQVNTQPAPQGRRLRFLLKCLLQSRRFFILQNKNSQSKPKLSPLKRWSYFSQVLRGGGGGGAGGTPWPHQASWWEMWAKKNSP